MERSSRRKWSAKEDKILCDNWHNGKPIRMWIDLLPGRNEAAAIQRAPRLGLKTRGNTKTVGNSPTWRMICHVLKSGEALSPLEIAQRIGTSRQHVYEELRNHHPAEVHIADYGKRGATGYRPKLWMLGPGPDAQPPKPLTQHEMNRRRWQTLKKNRPELLAKRDAKKRLKYAEQKGRLIRRDEAAAWITGVAA